MRLALATSITSVLLLSACATDSNDETTDSAADAGTESDTTAGCSVPTLELTNNTGNTIEVVHFLACDMSDGNDYPVPPPGLADGDSTTIMFPGPGCWILGYEGDGCLSEMPVTTPELACGESYVWVPDDLNHICQG